MVVTKEQYEEYLFQTLNMYYQVKSYFVVYDLLNKTRKDSLDKLNLAPGFFNTITLALMDGLILSLSKILEKNNKSFSIYKFLNISKANLQLFHTQNINNGGLEKVDRNTFTVFQRNLDQHEDFVRKLFIFRNKFTAHLDLSSLMKKKTMTLPEKEIEFILTTLHTIICEISIAFNGCCYPKEIYGIRDFEVLLEKIKTTKH